MRNKLIFGFVFLLLISAVGLAVARLSMLATDGVKSFYKDEQEGEKFGDLTKPLETDTSFSRWRELDEKPPEDPEGQRFIVVKWGKEIVRDHPSFLEMLKRSAKTPLPYILLLLAILLFKFYRSRKKRKRRFIDSYALKKEERIQEAASPTDEDDEAVSSGEIHQIRELFKKWEKGLPFHQRKRPHETVHEWFQRIEGPWGIVSIYERVRYGGKESSEDELRLVKETLAEKGW
ncbi:DUF4129 domain-containing protein [Rossellomorea aquimaris]|uniref:DUF4129 domain-containing protein n=1 Tax=Rossellomorea aquimaris TaxID=189382 RepID=UPI001CD34450|nr:DUF4129 domain-containing protein [Rossellomorea aquimaris]MCA1056144.1 DUF4129 domain-containing protein [Rossellomorea aquimaris]